MRGHVASIHLQGIILWTYPMLGKKYYINFPTMAFYLSFTGKTKLEFVVKQTPDLYPGSSHTVGSNTQPLGDALCPVC
ncbi:MAG: hypothetical protein IVW55_03685 [Chloroflexi bacterium]|nr:hypothetical protein [Chloroflexota bacterium]